MRTKKRFYLVEVSCPKMRRRRGYKLRATRQGRAWFAALDEFFAEFPSAVERGLTVGGFVEIFTRWARLHKAAIAANAN